MAGFRIGRGRDQAAQAPGAAQHSGYPPAPGQQPPTAVPPGEPEYFGEPAAPGYGPYGRTPGYDDVPGHTQAFSVGGAPGGYGDDDGYDGYGGYGDRGGYGAPADGGVSTYRAGRPSAPPSGPRLHWKELLSGILLRPRRTFWQMRDYQVWGPALLVTFGYGLLAVFGFDQARTDVLSANASTSVPWVLMTAVAVVLGALIMGSVTHALARQFGGDGSWAPTVGLSMLITCLTDAPRLPFAIFLGGANNLVQIIGWTTWLACAALLTSMVGKSHDLPWPRALGACSLQLLGLLVLFKLPTL